MMSGKRTILGTLAFVFVVTLSVLTVGWYWLHSSGAYELAKHEVSIRYGLKEDELAFSVLRPWKYHMGGDSGDATFSVCSSGNGRCFSVQMQRNQGAWNVVNISAAQ
jgi:hypothetical protein